MATKKEHEQARQIEKLEMEIISARADMKEMRTAAAVMQQQIDQLISAKNAGLYEGYRQAHIDQNGARVKAAMIEQQGVQTKRELDHRMDELIRDKKPGEYVGR